MKKDTTLILIMGACAVLLQIFKGTFLQYFFAGGLIVSIIIFTFASIIWIRKEKSK